MMDNTNRKASTLTDQCVKYIFEFIINKLCISNTGNSRDGLDRLELRFHRSYNKTNL